MVTLPVQCPHLRRCEPGLLRQTRVRVGDGRLQPDYGVYSGFPSCATRLS